MHRRCGSLVDPPQKVLLSTLHEKLHKHRYHRQNQAHSSGVKSDVQTTGQSIHRLFRAARKCLGIHLTERVGNPNHRPQKTQHRHRPTMNANHRVARMQRLRVAFRKTLKILVQSDRRSSLDLSHQKLPKPFAIPGPCQIVLLELPQRLQRCRAAIPIHRRLNIPLGTMIHPPVEHRFKRMDQPPLTPKHPKLLYQINRCGREQPSRSDSHPMAKRIPYHQRMTKRRKQNHKVKQTTQRRPNHNRRQKRYLKGLLFSLL